MHNRQEIERILRGAYEARKQGDVPSVLGFFHDNGRFKAVGSPAPAVGREQNESTLKALVQAFELLDYEIHCMVIEGSKAAVHWRGRFRATATGKIAETDLLDLVEVENGRISSFLNFFDTALAAQLQAP